MPLTIDVMCVCRRPPTWVSEAVADYAARVARELQLSFRYLPPAPDSMRPDARKHDEGARLAKKIPVGNTVIALDAGGRSYTSEQFAAQIGRLREDQAAVTMLIGGADGLAGDALDRAHARWSLSPLTLPHLLAQVVLAEQIFRACSILGGHPYHRA